MLFNFLLRIFIKLRHTFVLHFDTNLYCTALQISIALRLKFWDIADFTVVQMNMRRVSYDSAKSTGTVNGPKKQQKIANTHEHVYTTRLSVDRKWNCSM